MEPSCSTDLTMASLHTIEKKNLRSSQRWPAACSPCFKSSVVIAVTATATATATETAAGTVVTAMK